MNVKIKKDNKNKKVLFKNLSNSSNSNLKALERRKNRLKQEQSQEEWTDYCLDRLFDPEELHYTPMPELLKRYKKRNLRIGRMFNLAKKYGYVPPVRNRIIVGKPHVRSSFHHLFFKLYILFLNYSSTSNGKSWPAYIWYGELLSSTRKKIFFYNAYFVVGKFK
jgi:hypothetical protein